MSGVGGGSGSGGVGAGGAADVAQELAEVKEEIKELKKAIEVQQQELKDEKNDAMRLQIATALVADKQRLVELQKKENRLAEQQQREQQQQQPQTQGGRCCPRSLSLSLPCADFTVVVAMPGLACRVSFVTL